MSTLHVALLGFGAVGKELALYLAKEQHILRSRTRSAIKLEKIFTRSPQKILDAKLDQSLIAGSWEELIEDSTINCIVELIGGTGIAKTCIEAALKAGKNVVTANKAILAEHGSQLWSLARKHKACIAFEASCGGGIPIIRALTDGLIANEIHSILGVLNGSCNFILSEMDSKKISFKQALNKAAEQGMVEADPALDIEGIDAAHKIAIMSGLAYNIAIDFQNLPCKGVSDIEPIDIQFGKKLGYRTKLIAASVMLNNTVCAWVHPAFLPFSHPLAAIEGPFNAIRVQGHKVGSTLYSGKGAGGEATASAVVSDLVSLANGTCQAVFNSAAIWPDINSSIQQSGMSSFPCPAYLRFFVKDELGVLAKIAQILAQHSISIARVMQEDYPHSEYITQGLATLIIITHDTCWSNVAAAVQEAEQLSELQSSAAAYPILEDIEY